MRNLFPALCAGLLLSATVAAEAPDSSGFYVGGMAGITEIDDDGVLDSFDFDDTDTAVTLFGGYKFFRHLAVEGRIADLGSYSVASPFGSAELDVTAVSAHVIGIIPFGSSGWELFGQLGLARLDGEVNGESGDETAGSAGIGVRFYPTPHLGLSLQTDAFAWEEDNGFGNDADFSVVATQFGVHYLF